MYLPGKGGPAGFAVRISRPVELARNNVIRASAKQDRAIDI
jgi:hypothetical protein